MTCFEKNFLLVVTESGKQTKPINFLHKEYQTWMEKACDGTRTRPQTAY